MAKVINIVFIGIPELKEASANKWQEVARGKRCPERRERMGQKQRPEHIYGPWIVTAALSIDEGL
ncbi:MAG: hypothetical protein IPL22_19320 [Bacteroidetes bacterium]|nr:hypothetical protein [Bacteroidota bacterium]